MTNFQYACFMAWCLVAFATIRLGPLFLPELLSGLNHFGKFLVYDVYTRLFPKQFYKLVVFVLKEHNPVDRPLHSLYELHKAIRGYPCIHPKTAQPAANNVIHEEPVVSPCRCEELPLYFKRFCGFFNVTGRWIDFIDAALGYYSQNLLVRIKPFREEIIKELFCATPFIPAPCKEFIKNYHTAPAEILGYASFEKLVAASRGHDGGGL